MEHRYPIFLVDRDSWMYMIEDPASLEELEPIDIEEQEFVGWDAEGFPVELFLDHHGSTQVRIVSYLSRTDEVRKAILRYARRFAPDAPFDSDEQDLPKLFTVADAHVEENSIGLVRSIKRRFGL